MQVRRIRPVDGVEFSHDMAHTEEDLSALAGCSRDSGGCGSSYALEFEDHFVIEPSFHDWIADVLERPGGRRCAEDFVYTSDTNTRWLSVEQLREMIRAVEQELAGASRA